MPRPLHPDDLLALRVASDPQLSPDGAQLAFVSIRVAKEENEYSHQIWLVNAVPGASARPFTAGAKSDRYPRWSPDGSQLAFTTNRSGKDQLWVMETTGGEARQLTRFAEGVSGAPVWSPDGSRIAFTATVGPAGPGLEDQKEDESDLYRKYTKDVRRITRIWYKEDGEGLFDPARHQQIFTIAAGEPSPKPQQITSGPWGHSDPSWAPGGGALAFVTTRRQDDDHKPFLREVWVQPLDQAAAGPNKITPDGFAVSHPVWSPDGSQIAFLGYEWHHYQGYSSQHLFVIGADGTGLRQLATNWDRTFSLAAVYDTPGAGGNYLAWTPDGTALISIGADCGRQQLYAIDVAGGEVTTLTSGDHCITGWSMDGWGRKLTVGLTRPDVPGDIYLVEGPDLARMTDVNEALFAEVELAPVEAYRFATASGDNPFLRQHGHAQLTQTDGWVMKPVGWREGEQYPAILQIHGGPMAMYGWTFFFEFQTLAAAGYAVIYTNPRGSQGYGQHFCACIKEDWGNLDYLDVMAGLEAALRTHPWIDAARTGIAGGSYGGFMTNWAIGQTDRFRAADRKSVV